jgi:hypothetical protein
MGLEHAMSLRRLLVQKDADLIEAHAGGLAAHDHADSDEIVVGEEAAAGGIAVGVKQRHVLPMAQHVGRKVESRRRIADREST